MHTLIALLFTAATACAIARPPGPYHGNVGPEEGPPRPRNVPQLDPPSRRYLRDYLLPRYLWPHFFGYEESPRVSYTPPQVPETDWLNKEIERINHMQERVVPRPITYNPYNKRIFASLHDFQRMRPPLFEYHQIPEQFVKLDPTFEHPPSPFGHRQTAEQFVKLKPTFEHPDEHNNISTNSTYTKSITKEEKYIKFALTPNDKGYFDPNENDNKYEMSVEGIHEGGGQAMTEIEPQRQIRQNPNLSRKKTLVAENLDELRAGLSSKDYRLPVSLLPSNLRWLKINRPIEVEESGHMDRPTNSPGAAHIHMLETSPADPSESIYGVALIAAVGAAIAMAVLGFSFGWYTLSKRAKAAADVDYPAYGVTGPTIDNSGDRKLAHSAHMYHYQHQKQQIIAMERNGMDQHNGSVSDPDSEEDNEEGHYTVYECPGFATTGDMEVKNPLFNEDPTPATPGKCEVVKPQPKE